MDLHELKEKYPDVIIEFKFGMDMLILDKLVVPSHIRKQGIGTQVMTDIIRIADEHNSLIMLSPSDSLGATSTTRLRKFYKRFGFVRNFNKTKKYELPNYGMYRFPNLN